MESIYICVYVWSSVNKRNRFREASWNITLCTCWWDPCHFFFFWCRKTTHSDNKISMNLVAHFDVTHIWIQMHVILVLCVCVYSFPSCKWMHAEHIKMTLVMLTVLTLEEEFLVDACPMHDSCICNSYHVDFWHLFLFSLLKHDDDLTPEKCYC